MNNMKVKKCIVCENIKPLERFVTNGSYKKSTCKVCDNARKLKWQRDNKNHYNNSHAEWRQENISRVRESIGKAANKHYAKIRQKALEAVGKEELKCAECGFEDVRALQIDHKNGGGKLHFKNSSSSTGYYKSMIDNPNDYQILCANCNTIKRYTNNERCSKYGKD